MLSNSDHKKQISAGIRILDKKYFDYLYEHKDFFDSEETLSLSKFISEIWENGSITMVFNTIKGKSLKNDIRRDLNDLYASVYQIDID
ncbi:MAG: hypothetical protein H7329_04905 [Opitutaceae bacterium]|nr:hypothetical protein [Cytophagales bacterium]